MKTKTLIIIGVFFLILVIISIFDAFLSNKLFSREDIKLESLFLLLAFIAAYIYAYITCEILQIDKDPVLRLQWHDIGATEQNPFRMYREKKLFSMEDEKKLKEKLGKYGYGSKDIQKRIKIEKDKAKTFFRMYNYFTNLQLVNDGNGSARDLEIETEYVYGSKVIKGIKKVTAMGPHGCTQLKYLEHPEINRHKVFNSEEKSYKEPFKIRIKYKDSQDKESCISFVADEGYNDGFKIEEKTLLIGNLGKLVNSLKKWKKKIKVNSKNEN